jgi:hypothetical protein
MLIGNYVAVKTRTTIALFSWISRINWVWDCAVFSADIRGGQQIQVVHAGYDL